MEGMRRHFSLGLRAIFFLTVPCSALLIVLAEPTIQLLFQRGLWSPADIATAAERGIGVLSRQVLPAFDPTDPRGSGHAG